MYACRCYKSQRGIYRTWNWQESLRNWKEILLFCGQHNCITNTIKKNYWMPICDWSYLLCQVWAREQREKNTVSITTLWGLQVEDPEPATLCTADRSTAALLRQKTLCGIASFPGWRLKMKTNHYPLLNLLLNCMFHHKQLKVQYWEWKWRGLLPLFSLHHPPPPLVLHQRMSS